MRRKSRFIPLPLREAIVGWKAVGRTGGKSFEFEGAENSGHGVMQTLLSRFVRWAGFQPELVEVHREQLPDGMELYSYVLTDKFKTPRGSMQILVGEVEETARGTGYAPEFILEQAEGLASVMGAQGSAEANPRARQNFLGFGRKAPVEPLLDYKEAIGIAEALRLQAEADYYLIKAPALWGNKPVWYFLRNVTHREFDRARASGIPQSLIKSANPWPTARWNLSEHRHPEDLTLAVLDTYEGTVVGPLSYLEVAGKAGASNPSGKRGQKQKMRKKKARDKRRDRRHPAHGASLRLVHDQKPEVRPSEAVRAQIREIEREIDHRAGEMHQGSVMLLTNHRSGALMQLEPLVKPLDFIVIQSAVDYLVSRLEWAQAQKSDRGRMEAERMEAARRANQAQARLRRVLENYDKRERAKGNPSAGARPGWWHFINMPGGSEHVAWIPTSGGRETRDAQRYLRKIGVKSHWIERSGQPGHARKPKSTIPYRWEEDGEQHLLTYWSYSRPHMAY